MRAKHKPYRKTHERPPLMYWDDRGRSRVAEDIDLIRVEAFTASRMYVEAMSRAGRKR